jgi:carboxylesterase type B
MMMDNHGSSKLATDKQRALVAKLMRREPPLTLTMSEASQIIVRHRSQAIVGGASSSEPATEKQVAFLKKLGLPDGTEVEGLTKQQASKLIARRLMARK